MTLVFEHLVAPGIRPAFVAKVVEISAKLQIHPNWLMGVIYKESAGTFRPDIQNTKHPFKNPDGSLKGYATGLIQFTPDTAKGLGTSTEVLKRMSPIQQLDFVYLYFKRFAGKLKSYADLYLCTFYPVALSKPDNWVIGLEKSEAFARKVAASNPGVNINKDGFITVGEFKAYTMKGFSESILNELKKKELPNSGINPEI